MSEVIQQFNVPTKTTVVREIPGSDIWKDDPFLIKFGDFEVQIMDKDMKTLKVFIDDQLFLDGKLVEGSPGDSFPLNDNNHHSIAADEPLPPIATLDGHLTDQGQHPQDHVQNSDLATAADLCKSISLCNKTVADLVDKKLLKFTKSKRDFFKKQKTTYSRERDEVINVLQRLSEQSRQVVQNEDTLNRQLRIKRRNQMILETIVSKFGRELRATTSQNCKVKKQLEMATSQCQEIRDDLRASSLAWADKLSKKDLEFEKIRERERTMVQTLKERDQTLRDVTKELSYAKEKVKSLGAHNKDLETKCTSLLDVITKERKVSQGIAKTNDRLCDEKKSLEAGIRMMEARMKEQRRFYEKLMNKMKESFEMEITTMKKTMEADIARRDNELRDTYNQLTEERNRYKALKAKASVLKARMIETGKDNMVLTSEVKLAKETLELATHQNEQLVMSQQQQIGHLREVLKILKENIKEEQRARKVAEDLHQWLLITQKAEQDKFILQQVKVFLVSCADKAVLQHKTEQIEKKNMEEAAEKNRRFFHLEQHNLPLQEKTKNALERYSRLHSDFEELQGRLANAEKQVALRDKSKDPRLLPNAEQIHVIPRIKELESQLLQKTNEQEDMRVLIRRLKKELSKTEKELAQMRSEKQDLITSMKKECTDQRRVVDDLMKKLKEKKMTEKKALWMRDDKTRRLATKITDLYQKLKVSYKDLQKNKMEADEEIEKLKTRIREMEDELDEMDEELENCEQDIEDLEDDLDDAEDDIEQKEKEIKKLKTQIDGLQKTNKNLETRLRCSHSKRYTSRVRRRRGGVED